MQVIPAVDVLDGKVVRLLRGSFAEVTVYGDDPVAVGNTLDRPGGRTWSTWSTWKGPGRADPTGRCGNGSPRPESLSRSGEASGMSPPPGPRSSQVPYGSCSGPPPSGTPQILRHRKRSPERVVAAIDVAEGDAVARAGPGRAEASKRSSPAFGRATSQRMLVTSISRDGTMEGPDLSLIEQVRRLAPEMALIASGGVGKPRRSADAGRSRLRGGHRWSGDLREAVHPRGSPGGRLGAAALGGATCDCASGFEIGADPDPDPGTVTNDDRRPVRHRSARVAPRRSGSTSSWSGNAANSQVTIDCRGRRNPPRCRPG